MVYARFKRIFADSYLGSCFMVSVFIIGSFLVKLCIIKRIFLRRCFFAWVGCFGSHCVAAGIALAVGIAVGMSGFIFHLVAAFARALVPMAVCISRPLR